MSSSSSLIGHKLGKYEITELLGQGGMATVYKGYQSDMDRFVAVKVLPPHPGQDSQFMDRFRLESRTIAQLQHPHILPVHDYGSESDILFLVMSYLEGGSLKDRIDQGPMSIEETETILRQVASALDYAHRHNIVHRDIKPDNILLDSEGNAILSDFGIVKILEGDKASGGLTATGGVLGTPAYMAPEQSQGVQITGKADIYALGVIVYEMLTGQQPFQADTPMRVMMKHITEPVPLLSDIVGNLPPALETVMMHVLAKEPGDRYDSATEFAQEFLRARHSQDADGMMRPPISTTQTGQVANVPQPTLPSNPTPPPTAPQQPVSAVYDTGQAPPARSGINPLVLLGGFAIIALLAVIAVLLVVSNGDASQTGAGPTDAPVVEASDAPATSVAAGPTAAPIKTFGRLSYSTTNQLGDTISLQVNGLKQPTTGKLYALWLTNTEDDSMLAAGILSVDGMGNGVRRYVDSEGRVLPSVFNALLITEESEAGDAPTGDVVYSGSTSDDIQAALAEIFVTSANGFSDGSLFGGALAEAELAVIHTSFDHTDRYDLFGLANRTEHTLNILMGTEVDYDASGLAENPGFGLGLAHFLDHIEAQLDFDTADPGVRADLNSDVVRVEACLRNTRQRLDELVALETGWTELTEAAEAFAQTEIRKSEAMLADLIEGVDLNQNSQIEGFPGECGLRQIPAFGLLLGIVDVTEGDLG